jgi:hypothetical protein
LPVVVQIIATFFLEEVLRRRASFDDAFRVDLVLLHEIDPILQRRDDFRLVVIGFRPAAFMRLAPASMASPEQPVRKPDDGI